MIASGGGVIINLGSWAAEFGPRGIRVNAASPSVTADPGRYPGGEHPTA